MFGDPQPAGLRGARLVIGVLTIESSCLEELERPVSSVPDTVQFWITGERWWKVRTYAIDHDVHTWNLGDVTADGDAPETFALEHIARHYGDILTRTLVLVLSEPDDEAAVRGELARHELPGGLQRAEFNEDRWAFWTPDGAEYLTQSGWDEISA
jgi:hypothetical protein